MTTATTLTGHSPFVDHVRTQVARTVVGQDAVVERVMIALLTGGHLLLEGVPGTAKTLLVQSVAKAIDLKFARVQFTIDLLPSDIVGSEILEQKTGEFRIHKGPIFTNLLLADEINRASPKVQSALLEAMQERRVSIGDTTHDLPAPFLVIATQNPVEQAGTIDSPIPRPAKKLKWCAAALPSSSSARAKARCRCRRSMRSTVRSACMCAISPRQWPRCSRCM